jgi:hypothetical protein
MDARLTSVESFSLAQKVRQLHCPYTFWSEQPQETDNIINDGYEHVSEYISIAQPNANTLAMLDLLEPSETAGDREPYLSPIECFLP